MVRNGVDNSHWKGKGSVALRGARDGEPLEAEVKICHHRLLIISSPTLLLVGRVSRFCF